MGQHPGIFSDGKVGAASKMLRKRCCVDQLALVCFISLLLSAKASGEDSTFLENTERTGSTASTAPEARSAETAEPASAPSPGSESTAGEESRWQPSAKEQAADSDKSDLPELSRLQALEKRLFNLTWPLDGTEQRLLRLERFALGAEGKGSTRVRLDKLEKVLSPRLSAETGQPASQVQQRVNDRPKGLLATINNGIDNYNKHRFHNAEDDFNDALTIAPGMSRIHVYLGATLLQLNQRKSAIDAMQAAYELDPFGQYGRYAKNCLLTLMGDEEVRKRGPKDNLKTVQRTLDAVNRQTDADMQRHNTIGSKLSTARSISVNNQASRISQDADNWSNEIALKQNFVRMDSMVQSARIRQDAAQRATYAQESANNLKALMTTKLLPGDAKLRAFGTTLNARYYGDETYNLAPWYIPREAPLELKAQAALLPSLKLQASPGRLKSRGSSAKAKNPGKQSLSRNSRSSRGVFSRTSKISAKKSAAKRSSNSLKSQAKAGRTGPQKRNKRAR